MSKQRWTETQGLRIVQQWQGSGQSMSEFAREYGLNVQRLMYWRKRVGTVTGGEEPRVACMGGSDNKFVPAVVVRGALTVHLCRGVVVEAESATTLEPEWLAKLQRALERAS